MSRNGFASMLRRVFRVACIIAGLGVILGSPSPAETVSDYKCFLDSTVLTLDQAVRMERAHPGSSQPVLDHMQSTIPANMVVTTPDGTIDTDFSQLRTDLRQLSRVKGKARIAKLTGIFSRVKLMRTMSSGSASGSDMGSVGADAKLREILSRSEYQPSQADSIRQWFIRLLDKLFSNASVSPGVADVFGVIVLVLLLAALVWLLVFITMRIISYYSVGKPASVRSATPIVRRKAPSVSSALETAERQASEGLYREAYRSAYLAAILALDRAKLVRYVDGTTNWEYLRTLSRQPNTEPVEVFQEMTATFDELIYGKRKVTREDYQTCVGKYRSLEEVVR